MENTLISIIIPIYNIEGFCDTLYCLITDLEREKINKEVFLINDGSSDNTGGICRELEKKYDFIRYIDKPHTGVSDTRNTGIRQTKGKYIMYIDADDAITEGSIEGLCNFFDYCYDDVDLITYPIETHYKGIVLSPHFRYKTMTYSGIYDLEGFPYVGQTTMNIVVKNKFERNVLFNTDMSFSEDQDYCVRVLKDKLKIGFYKDAAYIYNRSEASSSGKINGSCYIFEQSMDMFERMFEGYERVPQAFQGLYINDLEWKMRSELLYPYHYPKEEFDRAVSRMKALLEKVDNDVILEHPEIDLYHKYYWLKQKGADIVPFYCEDRYGLKLEKKEIYSNKKVQIVITRIRAAEDDIMLCGYIKSVVFGFRDLPELYVTNNGREKRLQLNISSAGYYLCHTETNRFYSFRYTEKASEIKNLSFKVKMGGIKYSVTYYFMPETPFDHSAGIYDAAVGKYHISYNTKKGEYSVTPRNIADVLKQNNENEKLPVEIKKLRSRAVRLLEKKRIWLYYDCRGVTADNGYYKFLKDMSINDGIERYYVYTQDKKSLSALFNRKQRKRLIGFGSVKHKEYFLACERIVTAYIENNNIIPFPEWEYRFICDHFRFSVDYLQHGILHAVMPWKYSYEKNLADRVYISTDYERELFTGKYGYRKEDLVEEVMPRMKLLDKNIIPKKKILFAPSWRKYLVGRNINGKWETFEDKFIGSDYYKNLTDFVNSPRLNAFLTENGYEMELKLHPIFQSYYDCIGITNDRVRLICDIDRLEDYEVLITDFSSFMFDFVYLNRKVFSFIPDKPQFYCGMNSYREIEPESKNAVIEVTGAEDFTEKFGLENDYSKINFFE